MSQTEQEKQDPRKIDVFQHTFQAAVLRPGDDVLLCVNDEGRMDPSQMQRALESLRERFPAVHFTFVAGITGVVVHPYEKKGRKG